MIFEDGDRAMRIFQSDCQENGLFRRIQCIEFIANEGASFVLSYAKSEEGSILAEGFRCREIEVRRNISGFSSSRKKDTELLISNIARKE